MNVNAKAAALRHSEASAKVVVQGTKAVAQGATAVGSYTKHFVLGFVAACKK